MPEKKGIAVEFIREEVWLQSHTASVAAGSMVLDKQKKTRDQSILGSSVDGKGLERVLGVGGALVGVRVLTFL